MSSFLTSSGVRFNDGTVIDSKYSIIPQTYKTVFYMSSAPTGWTRMTDAVYNNSTPRLVNGNGGSSGGTLGFLDVFKTHPISGNVPVTISGLTVQNTTLSTPQIASHAHYVNNNGSTVQVYSASGPRNINIVNDGSSTGATGGSQGHNHPITYTSASGPFSSTLDMNITYIDVLVCSYN